MIDMVEIDRQEGKFNVRIQGRIDTSSAAVFQQEVSVVLEDDKPEVVMDCEGLEYTSSLGLRMFLMLQKQIAAKGGSLVLVNMKPQVKEVFDITGFSNIIDIR